MVPLNKLEKYTFLKTLYFHLVKIVVVDIQNYYDCGVNGTSLYSCTILRTEQLHAHTTSLICKQNWLLLDAFAAWSTSNSPSPVPHIQSVSKSWLPTSELVRTCLLSIHTMGTLITPFLLGY